MKNIVKKVLLIVGIFVFTQSLSANEQVDLLKKRLMETIDKVVLIVENKKISKPTRNDRIIDTITPMFDFELMAKLSLGKTWKKLDKANKELFIKLYVQRMKKSYSSKLDGYSDEKVEIVKTKQPKKNRIVLVTNLLSKSESLEIVYKFYKPKKQKKDKNNWLIYDAEVLGVSILKTDKVQFREFLQDKTISDLMDKLANR